MKCKPGKSGTKLKKLFEAIEKADLRGVTKCLKAVADTNILDDKGWTPLQHAALHGRADVVTLLLIAGADPNIPKIGMTPLHLAAVKGDAAVTTHLLIAGADPNILDKFGGTPLHYAAARGHVDVVALLLDKNADPNILDKDDQTPLHRAVKIGDAAMVTLLLERGANPEIKDQKGAAPSDLILKRARSGRAGFQGPADWLKKFHPELVLDNWTALIG